MPTTRAQSSSFDRAPRFEFLDVLRGIAALLMIEGHSMRALLHWNIRASLGYDIHELFHGLPAPIFIFAAGAAVALTRKLPSTNVADAAQSRWNWHRESRLLSVLVIAYALQLSDFSFAKTFLSSTPEKLKILLNFNVLQCIVAGVVVVRAFSSIRWSDKTLMRVLFSATLALGVATPLVWEVSSQLPLWFGTMLSRHYSSYFPLFPYLGFALGGAAWGLAFNCSRQSGDEGGFLRRTIVCSGIVFAICVALAAVPWPKLYEDFWWSSPWYLWLRIALLALLCAFLRRWENATGGIPGRSQAFLAALGRRSFYVYVGHLIVLYGSSYNYNWNMYRKLGTDLSIVPASLATAALVVVMIVTTLAWDWAKREQPVWAHRIKWSLASYLAIVFLSSY